MVDLNLLQDFHFVRPWWILMLAPACLLGWSLKFRQSWESPWSRFIDPLLLSPLLKGKINKPGNLFPYIITLFWVIAVLSLAGPAWEKNPQSVKKIDNALVILLDLSPSMLAADVKPARLITARHKIIDLLNMRNEGYTALVAYSGDAHVVAPLTDDNTTIINLVNVLEPAIMPVDGSNLEHAIEKSLELFANSGYSTGDILLISDGITEQAKHNSANLLSRHNFRLSIIGVGTETGGPIPSARGGYIKDENGNIIIPILDSKRLRDLADDVSGSYIPLQLGDKDISPLVHGRQRNDQSESITVERDFDQWRDMGAMLSFPLLILILFAFRRGIILGLFCLIPLLPSPSAQAEDGFWDKLWLNDNQRAMEAVKQKDFKKASNLFKDPEWKSFSQYQKQEYESSAIGFSKRKTPNSFYNKGNSLAKSGHYQEAIDSYSEAIKLKPDFESAKHNKKVVEKILKNQQNQQNDNSSQEADKQSESQQEKNGQSTEGDEKSSEDREKKQKDDLRESESEQSKNNEIPPQGKKQETNDASKPADKAPIEHQDSTATNQNSLGNEDQRAMEQWLRKVPDDPSDLLKNKFQYYYHQQITKERNGQSSPHLNKEDRW
jgi:Ca-activated chloride channel family protein